ncbi:MAG: endonuclease VII domain-containing protein [Actinomycetota bacterium]
MISRRCPSCGETKSLDSFVRNRSTTSGYGPFCKPCHNSIGRANRIKHHGSTRSFHLKRRYGVDAVQVEWMILQQDGKCALCRVKPAKHVDHDHETDRVRGILCFNCNRGLGYFKDDWELMCRAADYLESYSNSG